MRKDDNLPPSCAVVTKSGNFSFLEPCGPVQASNGTALPLTLKKNLADRLVKMVEVWKLLLSRISVNTQ